MYVQHLLVITITTHRLYEMGQDELTSTVPAQTTEHTVLHQHLDFDELIILDRANAHRLTQGNLLSSP